MYDNLSFHILDMGLLRARVQRPFIYIYSQIHKWDDAKTKSILDVYGGLKSPDVEIMLDLLAETKGSSPAMRILTLLDPEFLTAWRTQHHMQVRNCRSIDSSAVYDGSQ